MKTVCFFIGRLLLHVDLYLRPTFNPVDYSNLLLHKCSCNTVIRMVRKIFWTLYISRKGTMETAEFFRIYWREPVDSKELHQPYHIIGMTGFINSIIETIIVSGHIEEFIEC